MGYLSTYTESKIKLMLLVLVSNVVCKVKPTDNLFKVLFSCLTSDLLLHSVF